MVEHLFCKQRVIGSIPVTSTIGRLGKLKYVEYFRQPESVARQPERQSVILNEVKNLNKIKDISLITQYDGNTFRQPERQAERIIETIYFNLRKLSSNAEIFNKLESRNQQTMKAVI